MIPYINDRMNRWAEWRERGGISRGIGYPSRAAFVRMTPSENGLRSPGLDDDCFACERAFVALMHDNEPLAEVLYLFHCRRNMTVAQMARECRVCRDTFYARVTRGHQAILGYLDDIATGVPLPWPEGNGARA